MREVWITGMGIVSPLGIGKEAVGRSLLEGTSAIGPITQFDAGDFPIRVAAEVKDFKARKFVRNRKSLKVSRRNAHLGLAAGRLAWDDAELEGRIEPDRAGVVLGTGRTTAILEEVCNAVRIALDDDGSFNLAAYADSSRALMPPYWFLRHIPNMVPAHLAIELQTKGPSDTVCMSGVGGAMALKEGADIVGRGDADVILAGASDANVEPYHLLTHFQKGRLDPRNEEPLAPFEKGGQGTALGEGAVVFVLESRESAERRGKAPIARFEESVSGRYVDLDNGASSVLHRPEEPRGSRVMALTGLGFPDLDRVEIDLAMNLESESFTCYRNLGGWMNGTTPVHDLACLLLEAEIGTIRTEARVKDPTNQPERWKNISVRQGDMLGVQSLSWTGQYAAFQVRLG